MKSYVPTLIDRPKWLTSDNEVRVGDVVLFLKSEKEFKKDYQYGIVHMVLVGRDGQMRVTIHPVDEPGISAELAEMAQQHVYPGSVNI